MKTIRTEEAVGLPLSHDITRIDYGKTKEVCFKKGHIVVQEDIPILLSLGKKHLFVSLDPAEIHEEEAATFLYNLLTDDSCQPSEVHEGKLQKAQAGLSGDSGRQRHSENSKSTA